MVKIFDTANNEIHDTLSEFLNAHAKDSSFVAKWLEGQTDEEINSSGVDLQKLGVGDYVLFFNEKDYEIFCSELDKKLPNQDEQICFQREGFSDNLVNTLFEIYKHDGKYSIENYEVYSACLNLIEEGN